MSYFGFGGHSQVEPIDTGSESDDADVEILPLAAEDEASDERTKAPKPLLEGEKWKLVNWHPEFLADLSLESSASHSNHGAPSSLSSPKDFLHDRQLLLNQQLRAAKGSELKALLEKCIKSEDTKEAAEAKLRHVEEMHDAELAAKEKQIQDLQGAFEELGNEVKERFAFLEAKTTAADDAIARLSADLAAKEKEIQDLRGAYEELENESKERFAFLEACQRESTAADTDVMGRLSALEHYHGEAMDADDAVKQRLIAIEHCQSETMVADDQVKERLSALEHCQREAMNADNAMIQRLIAIERCQSETMVADNEVKERLAILEDSEAWTAPLVNEWKVRLAAIEVSYLESMASDAVAKERLTALERCRNEAIVTADVVKQRLMAVEHCQREAMVACGEMRERLVALEAGQAGKVNADDETEYTKASTLGDGPPTKPSRTSTNQGDFDLFQHIISQGKNQQSFVANVAVFKPTSVAHLIRFLGSAVSLAYAIPRILLEFQPQPGQRLPERPSCFPRLPGGEVDSTNKRVETHRFKNRNSGEEFNVRLFLDADDRVEIVKIRIAKNLH